MSCNIIVSGIDECDREDDNNSINGSNTNSRSSSIDSNSSTSSDTINFTKNYVSSSWSLIPEPVLHNILYYLTARDILQAGQCCRRWNDISKDDFLWRKIFQRDFKVDRTIAMKPGECVLVIRCCPSE